MEIEIEIKIEIEIDIKHLVCLPEVISGLYPLSQCK